MKINKRCPILALILLLLLGAAACTPDPAGEGSSFIDIGGFSIKKLADNCKEITDGAGRILVLVPRGQNPPPGYDKNQIIKTPVRRVVAYSGFNVSMLKALGVLDTLVGVTHPQDYWTIDDVISGMESGRITYIGEASSIDFEKLKSLEPDLVLTWDPCTISITTELDIPGVITVTGEALNLDTRIRFAHFLARFFNREKEAAAYVARVKNAIKEVEDIPVDAGHRPRVIWGNIYEKRVLVEPANSWAAEMVELAGGDYLFADVFGAS